LFIRTDLLSSALRLFHKVPDERLAGNKSGESGRAGEGKIWLESESERKGGDDDGDGRELRQLNNNVLHASSDKTDLHCSAPQKITSHRPLASSSSVVGAMTKTLVLLGRAAASQLLH
jgi:hypothetical protein